ncbi:MAG TPA: efflux RND transporter periplasmic adaptor subunit, partial [Gemmatimonadales bacterium]|nr:efflux RND transporter periplasmic adaptor subunit [Gemmatimonadales bacterium]
STQVLAPISGPVTRLLVELGTRVTAGQALASVASPDFAADVAQYRKALVAAENTRRIADQNEQLWRNDAIARRDLDQSETDAAQASADRDAAAEQLRAIGVDSVGVAAIAQGRAVTAPQGVIRAPIAGVVVERLVTPGQLLTAGTTPCFTVADLATVWVMANVFESDLPDVAVGDPADVEPTVGDRRFGGTVDYVGALVDPQTRATAVRIVARNRDDFLKRDMFVRVAIHARRPRRGLLVPVSAVLRDAENLPFVFVAARDSSFARRQVTLGSRVGDRLEIASGLAPTERIIVEGGLFLQFAESQ